MDRKMEDMKGLRILVVDDDESLVAIISEVLEDDGYEVTTASSGEDAIELFRNKRFPLVITDIRMPGMTGIELLQEVKKIHKDTEVIIITSHASVETTISALRMGAYDYLLKPFEEIELISAVAKRAIDKIRLTTERSDLMDNLMRNREELEHLNSVFHKLSVRDGLTGLYNHRYFYETASLELVRCQRDKCLFSLVFIDVDNFKEYNDSHGHPAGDEVLKKMGEFMTERLRRTDIAARYGGEEFVILLPETSKSNAAVYAEALRKQIEENPFQGRETQPLGIVSVSMGVASYPDDGEDLSLLINSADDALYRAKAAGRNKIIEAGPVVNKG
jgi:diguanylate cyclase (GGDEF)-like protein